ncbi:bucentaur or craniofacial development-domain-containing protein [Pilobolus umbonatus]|nr:bucentaur or craniofacial development-domain-containing protein [Pilobolus umbonatus]
MDKVDLNYLYNNAEESDSEEDSDFVPENSDEESDDLEEEEEDKETNAASSSSSSKRVLENIEDNELEHSNKKARIDAIWEDMNKSPKEKGSMIDIKGKSKEIVPVTEEEVEKEVDVRIPDKKKSTIVRPKSSLSSLISQYNIKEPKMNTLEKSRLDWQGYVDREGIREELKYKNKDGYMEKVAFLNRVDDRRISQMKSGKKEANSSNNKQ